MSETQTEEKPASASASAATTPADGGGAPDAGGAVDTAPCFCCGSRRGVPVAAAYWGLVWPRLLHHVRCVDCPASYNARTGRSNGGKVLLLHLVHLLLGVGVAAVIFATVYRNP